MARRLHRPRSRPSLEADELIQVCSLVLGQAVAVRPTGTVSRLRRTDHTVVVKRHFETTAFVLPPDGPRVASDPSQMADLCSNGDRPAEADLADRLAESLPAVHRPRRSLYAPVRWTPPSADSRRVTSARWNWTDGARLMLQRAWRELTRDEQLLLRMRFYEEKSQSEIASEIGTSQMQVSRLLARTLRRLRSVIGTLDAAPLAS